MWFCVHGFFCNKILISLAGSSWGKDKETLLATYKAIGRPLGCSAPQTRKEACQNTALRTITGRLLMSPIEHVHRQARMLPVKEHNELLSKQFLLGCFRRNHPCSRLLEAEPPPRNIKRSLITSTTLDSTPTRLRTQWTLDTHWTPFKVEP